jgi:hypothetical protein
MWLFCADAATGRLRSQDPQGPAGTSLVGDPGTLYVSNHDGLPDEQGIAVMHPQADCKD